MFCPNCGEGVPDNARICGNCGQRLSLAGASSVPPPKQGTGSGWASQRVYVQLGGRPRGFKRSTLLILLLLMLLLVACGCLAYSGGLAIPRIVADFLGRYARLVAGLMGGGLLFVAATVLTHILNIDGNWAWLPVAVIPVILLGGILDNMGVIGLPEGAGDFLGNLTEPIFDIPLPWEQLGIDMPCGDFKGQVRASEISAKCLSFSITDEEGNEDFGTMNCWASLSGLKDFKGLYVELIKYGQRTPIWEGECDRDENDANYLVCDHPPESMTESAIYWLVYPELDCRIQINTSQGTGNTVADGCCEIVGMRDVSLTRWPPDTGPLHLSFMLECDGSFGLIDSDDYITGDTFVRADFSEHWTEVVCHKATHEADNMLYCTSPKDVDLQQKKSKSKVILSDGKCTWESEFQSPYYAPKPEPVPAEPESPEEPCDGCETVKID